MFIEFNGLMLGGGDPHYGLETPITGLETPPIRVGADNYSGRDGGFVSAQYWSYRTIILKILYSGDSCEDADAARLALGKACQLRTSLPLYVTTFSGNRYYADVYVDDLKMDLTSPTYGEAQLTLIAPDPLWYAAGTSSNPDSNLITSYVFKRISGGYVTPYKLPVQWVPGQEYTTITNTGDVALWPVLTFQGVFTNLKVTNLTTGQYIKIANTFGASDTLTIDMKNGAISLDGTSWNAYRTVDSSWWQLQPGGNKIIVESDLTSDNIFGTIQYNNAWIAI